MNDDWRVKATVASKDRASEIARELGRGEHGHTADQHVIVSHDDNEVFLYAGTQAEAEAAAEALRSLEPTAATELRRWDAATEDWESADAPAPSAEKAAEERIEHEREESEEAGFDEYEVRVQLHHHHDTRDLADRLEAEGINCVRRWRFLLIGAEDERSANALADRIRVEAPAGTEITVEGSYAAVEEYAPQNPFRYFGGLGG